MLDVRRLLSAAVFLLLPTFGSAAVVSDFEPAGTDGGTAAGGLNPLTIAPIGTGACADLVAGSAASGSALCGFDIADSSTPDDFATYTIEDIDFNAGRVLRFSLAAGNTDTGDFEDNDYVRVEVNGVLVGAWAGGDPDTVDRLLPTGGLFSADLVPTFAEFSVPFSSVGGGTGDVVFTFFNTGNSEVYGLDNVIISPVPLPASALLLLGGIAGLGALRRRKAA